jgi:hypothetical protein
MRWTRAAKKIIEMADTEILPHRDTLVAPDTALRLRIEIDETAAELSDILPPLQHFLSWPAQVPCPRVISRCLRP